MYRDDSEPEAENTKAGITCSRGTDSEPLQSRDGNTVTIRLSLGSLGESISRYVCCTLHMLNFKVKHLNPCNPLGNKGSREICSSTIQLSYQNLCICFQDKVDSIQLVPKSLEAFENSTAFPLSGIVVVFCLILDSRFISGHLLFLVLIKLSHDSALSFKAYIYSNINLTPSWPILNFA